MTLTPKRVQVGDTPQEPVGAEILRRVDLWAEKGLISRGEAAAIRDFESAGGETRSRRIAPLIQALLYMGTALTLAALGTIYWELYGDLGQTARVVTPGFLAVVLATAGWFTTRRTDPDVRRFGGVLWLLSTGAIAGFMSELVTPNELAGNWSLFVVGVATAVWAGTFALLSPQATTQIGLFGTSVVTMVGLVFGLTKGLANESDIAWLSLPLTLLGVGWIVAGRFRLFRPAALADVLGGAIVLYAPTLLFGSSIDEGIALLLGSVIAGSLLGAAASLRSTALLAIGAVGLYAYSFRAIWVYFGDTIGMPVVLLIGGLLLLAIAFAAIRLGSQRRR